MNVAGQPEYRFWAAADTKSMVFVRRRITGATSLELDGNAYHIQTLEDSQGMNIGTFRVSCCGARAIGEAWTLTRSNRRAGDLYIG